MTDQHHGENGRVAEFPADEPSIPTTHDSVELTDGAVVVFDREDSQRWMWTDEGVHLPDCR